MQAVAARRHHDVLQEHAVVEPAPQLKPPVDGEDQADRRVEEDVIAAALLLHALLFALLDAEQAVKAPADGAAPAEIGLEELIRIIFPLTLFGAGAGRSEEHTSELQSLMRISYAVFCLKKKKHTNNTIRTYIHTHTRSR